MLKVLKLHLRTYLVAATTVVIVASFSLGTYYGREIISFVDSILSNRKDAEPSRFAYRTSNNNKVIVFIHGVTGAPDETWTYQDKNTNQKTFWPDLIKTDDRLKDYDIFMLSYYTPIVESGPSVAQIADNMYRDLEQSLILPDRSQLTNEKSKKANYAKLKYKEVVVIAHSMGNLVIRTMMALYRLPEDSPVEIPLILSFASPSAGSALAEFAQRVALNETYSEMISREKNSFIQLLDSAWENTPFDTEIACAYEERPEPHIGRKVVERASATRVCTRSDYRGFEKDHVSIVKPKDRDDPVYVWTVQEIKDKPRKKEQWVLPRWEQKQIIVAGKDYAESNLHAAIITLVLRDGLGLNVTFNYNMGYASYLFSALVNKDIDVYPEYDGSLLYEYLHRPLEGALHDNLQSIDPTSPDYADFVNNELKKTPLNVEYLASFGFNDPYVLVMKRADADRLGLINKDGKVTISGLRQKAATNLALVADEVFFYRNEWSQLKKQYDGLTFADQPLARHSEVYDRVRKGRPDNKAVVAVGFGTDRELNPIADDLVQIEDDRKVFPAYYAGPLVNGLLLRKFPDVKKELARLKGIINSQEMADLVKSCDEETARLESAEDRKKKVEEIARRFLQSKGVLAKS